MVHRVRHRLAELMNRGRLPLHHLDLVDNRFEHPPPAALIRLCNDPFKRVSCLGLPPHSCTAFGKESYAVRSDNRRV